MLVTGVSVRAELSVRTVVGHSASGGFRIFRAPDRAPLKAVDGNDFR
jgi:hypothetical protein